MYYFSNCTVCTLGKFSLWSSVYVCLLPTVEINCLIYKLNCGGYQLTKITAWSKIISMYGSVQVWVCMHKHVSVPELSKFRYLIKLFSEINLDYSIILHFEHSAWQKVVCTTRTKRILMVPSLYGLSLIYRVIQEESALIWDMIVWVVLSKNCVSGSLSPRHGASSGWREERPPIRRVAANKLNKQTRTADEGWSPSLGVGRGANNPSLLKPMFSNTHRRDDSSGHKTIRR